MIGLTSAGLTANYDDLAAKEYRRVTIDGPYGFPAKDDLQQIVKKPTDETELQMIKQTNDLKVYGKNSRNKSIRRPADFTDPFSNSTRAGFSSS